MIRRIALLTRCLDGGGIQRSLITLGEAFVERGFDVDLVVGDALGPMREACPASMRLLALPISPILRSRIWLMAADPAGASAAWPLLVGPSPRMIRHLPALVRYLHEERPGAVVAAGTQANLAALLARRMTRLETRIVVSERNAMSVVAGRGRGGFRRAYPRVARRLFPEADAIVAVSQAVADDLVALDVAPRERVFTIHNPVVTRGLDDLIAEPLEHPWLRDGEAPVVLAVGRLHWQKDFPTLLRAFRRMSAVRTMRLVVLGEGDERGKLEALSRSLGIAERVLLPGFVANPFPWMARAAVVVVSSLLEGFGRVLPEAMACGCPVVSVDCPGGPREILDNGRYGPLVPVGNEQALADAVLASLVRPPDRAALRQRANQFSADAAAERYLEILVPRPC
jgi:glycosyltransferase involved in cell wall biosynthesis